MVPKIGQRFCGVPQVIVDSDQAGKRLIGNLTCLVKDLPQKK